MTIHPEHQIGLLAEATDTWQNEGGSVEPESMRFTVDESAHNRDGLLLHGRDGAQPVTAFISRRVMDDWANAGRLPIGGHSLFRDQYNALGRRNLPAIQRIATRKYQRGLAFNHQHPFVDVLFSDITQSGEVLGAAHIA
jgi:hypothetical protein